MARKKPARLAAKKSGRRTTAKKAAKATRARKPAPPRKKGAAAGARRKQIARRVTKAVKKAGQSARTTARSTIKKARSAARKVRSAARKATSVVRKATKTAVKRQTVASTAVRKAVRGAVVTAKTAKAGVIAAAKPPKTPNLDRPRKTVADIHGTPSSLGDGGISSSARSGRSDLRHQLREHTSSSPALTGGDIDADWQSADSIGDEAPGGDNPTPDQDVVEEIGRALGVEYRDGEALQGGDEIADRDRHRWELDPSSKDDFEDVK